MNSKQIYTKFFKEYALSDEQLEALHNVELSILKDVKTACEKFGLKYMLSGGSVLGAIRHGGFIPWDDDIDIMMYRDDYNKIDQAMEELFGDKYIVKSNDNDKAFVGKAKKIYLRGTEFTELEKENYPEEKCVFVDIFAIDNIPNNKVVRKIRGMIHDFAFLATGAIYCYKYPSAAIMQKAKEEKTVRRFYRKKRIVGAILSAFFGFKFYMALEKKLSRYARKTKLEGLPTAIRYNREVFEAGFFSQTVKMDFEGEEYPVPKRYHEYLSNLYGDDYMQIPKEEDREIHTVVKIKL